MRKRQHAVISKNTIRVIQRSVKEGYILKSASVGKVCRNTKSLR